MRKLILKLSLTSLLLSFLIGCASSHINETGFDQREFERIIAKYTQKSQKYQGFYNTYNIRITFLNSLVEDSLLRKKRNYFQWEESEYRKEREKVLQVQSSKSKVMMAFYTPERKDNNLDKPKSIWKIYLKSNGVKYPGTVKKMKVNRSEFARLFPHYTRWDTPYEVTFDAPMSVIEQKGNTVIVTSSVGSSTFDFPGVEN